VRPVSVDATAGWASPARWALVVLLLGLVALASPRPAVAQLGPKPQETANEVPCNTDGTVPVQGLRRGSSGLGQQPDLLIDRDCKAQGANTYYFGTVRIINKGTLRFVEPATAGQVNFWASNIKWIACSPVDPRSVHKSLISLSNC
jgi:hypothetical protein